jgi:uracil-DNA glycosylase
MSTYASQLSPYLADLNALTTRQNRSPPEASLQLWSLPDKKLSCFYAPFEYVNTDAKLIIVGITPGRTQMNRSVNALNQALSDGQDLESALKSVKKTASLSGTMRPRLVEILNRLGYAEKLGIDCCSSLWAENNHLVHFCSVLKYPIFVNGKDYCGQPKLFNISQLKTLLFEQFVKDMQSIQTGAYIVPLGEMVADVLTQLDASGNIKHHLPRFDNKIVSPPHPSGANAESISLLLMNHFPTLSDYQDKMYQHYLDKQGWLKKSDGKPQDEDKYKKARAARWYAMSRVRQAYKL